MGHVVFGHVVLRHVVLRHVVFGHAVLRHVIWDHVYHKNVQALKLNASGGLVELEDDGTIFEEAHSS